MNKHINKLAAILIFISACKVSKDVVTPTAELPVTYRNSAPSSDSTSIAEKQWKSFFTGTALIALIDSAIMKNFDLQIAVKNIEASHLLFKQVKWNYLPQLKLNVTGGTNRPSDNSITGLTLSQNNFGEKHVEDYSANLGLSWEADIWNKIRSQSNSALAQYLQTSEAKKAIQTNLVAAVSQGYFNLLMLDAQLEIARKNVRLNDSTLRIIRLQFEAGQVTQLAVQQAQAQQLSAAQLIPGFERDIVIQENAIRILTGTLPDKVERTARLDEYVITENLSTGLPSAILSNRPDVKSAELALKAANASVGFAQANMYPSLTIAASAGLNTFRASNWFTIPASLFGNVAGAVSQPLLQHRRLKTQYKVALVEREKTVLQFRQSVLNAVGEVSDALVRIEKLKTQQSIIAKRVSTLQQATNNARLLFSNGQASYLEVITAQGNVLQSELDLATVKNARLTATSDLYRSLGGGWK